MISRLTLLLTRRQPHKPRGLTPPIHGFTTSPRSLRASPTTLRPTPRREVAADSENTSAAVRSRASLSPTTGPEISHEGSLSTLERPMTQRSLRSNATLSAAPSTRTPTYNDSTTIQAPNPYRSVSLSNDTQEIPVPERRHPSPSSEHTPQDNPRVGSPAFPPIDPDQSGIQGRRLRPSTSKSSSTSSLFESETDSV